ncbi:MAG TPA: hypothetical protein PK357_03290 [Candidatus Pacearchaeota archaeon]|nr:hypothetical protein [Candidatus Pacearchaeota archaeon]
MEISTIQLSKETKEKISSFGLKGESYDQIINRIYSLAVKDQLRAFLMSSDNCVPVEDALERAKKKWQR